MPEYIYKVTFLFNNIKYYSYKKNEQNFIVLYTRAIYIELVDTYDYVQLNNIPILIK